MIDEIVYAVQQEVLALFAGTGATVMLRTDFKSDKWASYTMPLFVIDVEPGDETAQMLGGLTMMDWVFNLSAYNHRPDISGMDPTGYSASTEQIADTLRVHFSNFSVFTTPEMLAAFNDFGIKWTLSGIRKADPLEHPDGLCWGHKIVFDTISWDDSTTGISYGVPLQTVQQVNNPPFS